MPVPMPAPVFRWFVAAQDASGLVPAAGYKAVFYSAGTLIPKEIYNKDDALYAAPSHIATLNSEGYADIRLGNGKYKLIVTDPDDAEVYTEDNISGGGTFGSGFVPTVMATDDPETNGLAQHNTTERFTWCAGYWAVGDGGHGFFWNETSADADDGGYTIASTYDPTKVWRRVPDEDDAVRAASFGYVGTRAGNLTDELLAACQYCTSYNKTLRIGPGDAAIIGQGFIETHLYAPEFYLEPGSMLTGNISEGTIVFHGYVDGSAEQHFTDTLYLLDTTQIDNHPEWSGGSYGSLDNTDAFQKWFQSGAGAYILPPGVWKYSNTTSFPYPSVPFLMWGSIDATTGSDIPSGFYGAATSRFRLNQILFSSGPTITGIGGDINIEGDSVAINGNLSAIDINSTGNVSVFGSISTTTGSIVSAGDVIAVAYQSGVQFKAGGQYQHIEDDAVTSGTGATNLLSTVIAAGTFAANGDHLRIFLSGISSGASVQIKTIAVTIGGLTICSLSLAHQSLPWQVEIDAWYSSSSLFCTSKMFAGGYSESDVIKTTPISWIADRTIQCIGTAAVTGDITQQMLSVQYFPANGRN
jgi:hypothetical protein